MSVAQTAPAPVSSKPKRGSLAGKIAGGTALAGILAAVTIAVWPASAADEARADGEQLGEAVAQLQAADTSSEVDAALTAIAGAADDTRQHAGDRVADQVAEQEDALVRALDGFVGATTADDSFEQDLYEVELDTALDDLAGNADDFRTTGPEVQQAYWEGFDSGLNGN